MPERASTILIVDDNPTGLYAKSRLLLREGYRVLEAVNGEDALTIAAAAQPDLVVLDVNLPNMNGFDVCRRLKTRPETRFMKVLQTSAARIGALDRVKGLEVGADAYLVEPAEGEELIGTVRALLKLAEQERDNRRLIERLTNTERRLREATDAADCGMWDWDIAGGMLEWFGAHERLAGMQPGSFSGKVDVFTEILHPDDRQRVWTRLDKLMARRETEYADDYRFIRPDGTVRWMSATGRFLYDEHGRAVRMTGVVQDVTARERAEEALRTRSAQMQRLYELADAVNRAGDLRELYDLALDAILAGLRADRASILLFDRDGVMRFQAWRRLSDAYRRIAAGHSPWRAGQSDATPIMIDDVSAADIEAGLKTVILQEGIRALAFIPLTDGGRVIGKFMAYFDRPQRMSAEAIDLAQGIANTLAIGIERKRDETVLRESEAHLGRELEATRALHAVSTALIESDDVATVYERILDAAVTTMRSQYASIQMWDETRGELKLLDYRGFSPAAADFWEWVRPASSSTCGVALRTHERVTVPDVTQCDWMAGTDDLAAYLETGIRAVQTTPLLSRDGRLLGMISTHWRKPHRPSPSDLQRLDILARMAADVLARRQSDAALRESEERLRLAFEGADLGSWDVDVRTGAALWNRRHALMQGYEPEAGPVSMQRWQERVHPEDLPRVMAAIECAKREGGLFAEEHRIARADTGHQRWLSLYGRFSYDETGEPVRFSGVSLDITERKLAEQALREAQERLQRWNVDLAQAVDAKTSELVQSHDRLRALATELNLAEQRERKRLAAELHDHLQQMLVLGKLKLGTHKRFADTAPAAAKVMKETDEVLSDALKYTRTLVAELSPPVLQDHGLSAGLHWLAESMKKHDLDVTVCMPEKMSLPVPEDQAILLFQSVRELLINSSKHAGTGAATVTMGQSDGRLTIHVCDHGVGFDLAAAAAATTPSGGISSKFGLFSIRERMKALGGSFEIESAPGKGTTAMLTLPLGNVRSPSCESLVVNSQLPDRTIVHSDNSKLTTQHSKLLSSRIRVLLVDDHAMVRQGLRAVMDGYPDIEVVGEAWDGVEAVAAVEQLRPAVVVMDINMPKMNGIEAAALIKARVPEAVVIGLSVNAEQGNVTAMQSAGAARLLTKEAAVEQLHGAILAEMARRDPSSMTKDEKSR